MQGEKVDDLLEVTLNLSGAMIYLGGKAKSQKEGIEISKHLITSGKAFDKFLEIVKLQGGEISVLKNSNKYRKSKITEKIFSEKSGYFSEVDCYEIGMASLELGAGRLTKTDIIDPKAGIIFHPKIGEKIKKGAVIAEIFTDKKHMVDEAKNRILSSVKISNQIPGKVKIIKSVISQNLN